MLKNLAIAGGGVLAFAYIGAIKELHKQGKLQNVNRFAGTSAGATIAALLACKCSPDNIQIILTNLELDNMTFCNSLPKAFFSLFRLYNSYGIVSSDLLGTMSRQIMKQACDNEDITFVEIYNKYGNDLIITASDLTTKKPVYFSKDTHPVLPVHFALKMSACVPMIFTPVVYRDHLYADGGLLDNYPIGVFDVDNTLGVKLVSHGGDRPQSLSDLTDYIKNISEIYYDKLMNQYVGKLYWDKTIPLPIKTDINFTDFDLNDTEIKKLIDEGSRLTREHIKNNPKIFDNNSS